MDYLGRPLTLETVFETFRPPGGTFRGGGFPNHPRDANMLRLSRYPVTSVASVVIDGTSLGLGPVGTRAGWYGAVIAVTYVAGYSLPDDLPRPIGQACLLLLRHRWMTGDRDPTIRAENVSDWEMDPEPALLYRDRHPVLGRRNAGRERGGAAGSRGVAQPVPRASHLMAPNCIIDRV